MDEISLQNPNNSLNNGNTLAHPAKEGKDCSVSLEGVGLVFFFFFFFFFFWMLMEFLW